MTISNPKYSVDHPARVLDRKKAIGHEFRALAERAEQSGWTMSEIALALSELVDGYFLIAVNDLETDVDVAIETALKQLRTKQN